MKIVIFTSDEIRHKFFANSLTKIVKESLVISETKNNELIKNTESIPELIKNHFLERTKTELRFFKNNEKFTSKTISVAYREASSTFVENLVLKFNPDAIFVFGSSILKNNIIELVPSGRFFNLHLGLSPYYRGSATNFWPFVNNELEYVGATIHYLDSGIDTGDIICHVRPTFNINDNVHTIGCKVIQEGIFILKKIIEKLKNNESISRFPQWKIPNEKVYRIKDFNESILTVYKKNMEKRIIENYIKSPKVPPKLIYFN